METAPNYRFERDFLSPDDWERLLLAGWDRVGTGFYHRRFDIGQRPSTNGEFEQYEKELMPLRYVLPRFQFSESQRKVFRKNADLEYSHGEAELSDEKLALFDRWHRGRFGFEASIFEWVSAEKKPLGSHEICFRKNGRLVAASYFDLTTHCQYSTTSMFEPEESRRSLGTLTLLAEIVHGIRTRRVYHFPGHAYREHSIYDYKKAFLTMEHFDWDARSWLPLDRL